MGGDRRGARARGPWTAAASFAWLLGGCGAADAPPTTPGGGDDAPAAEAATLILGAPESVREGVPFPLTLRAVASDGAPASAYSAAVPVWADWGAAAPDEVIVEGGRGDALLTLSRAGDARLLASDGALEAAATVRVLPAAWVREPFGAVHAGRAGAGAAGWASGGIHNPSMFVPSAELGGQGGVAPFGDAMAAGSAAGEAPEAWVVFATPLDPKSSDPRAMGLGRARATDPSGRGLGFSPEPDALWVDPRALDGDDGALVGLDAPALVELPDGAGGVDLHLFATAWRADPKLPPFIAHFVVDPSSPQGLRREPCLDLTGSAAGVAWAPGGVADPAAWVEGGRLRLFFTGLSSAGIGGEPVGRRIGLAEGSCAEGWSGAGVALDLGERGSWEGAGVCAPTVGREGDPTVPGAAVYKMLYEGHDASAGSTALGYATSDDGETWVRASDAPVVTRESDTDPARRGPSSPSVVLLDGQRLLFAAGTPLDGRPVLLRWRLGTK